MSSAIQPFSRKRGFSLIEVAMAIGIFSFCLISIMGLIPVALQTSRNSFDKSVEVRLVQSVKARLINQPYSTLPSGETFNFDSEGISTDAAADIHYSVTYVKVDSTVLPGSQSSEKLSTALLTISNVITSETHTNSLHLPDNGY